MLSYKLTKNLAVSESGFMFLPNTGETFTTNEIGRTILTRLQRGESEEVILSGLTAEYDVDAAILTRDLQDFIAQLRQYRLLTDES
jgi:hypothetical protein